MTIVTTLVLASSSVYRAQLLDKLGLPFERVDPSIDETPGALEAPGELVARLARGKALAVANAYPNAVVIGSDQVAVCGETMLGKPGTATRARAQLAELSGKEVVFLTSLCVFNTASSQMHQEVVSTPVTFRELSASEIADYVDRESPLDCAGAFKSEGLGIALFERIGGDDPNALIGLPLIALCSMLRAEGIEVLNQGASA